MDQEIIRRQDFLRVTAIKSKSEVFSQYIVKGIHNSVDSKALCPRQVLKCHLFFEIRCTCPPQPIMPTLQTNHSEKLETSHDTPSLIGSHDDTPSRHGSTTYPYRSLMKDGCFSRCHPVLVSPPSERSYLTESYSRALLRLGNGPPLWDPIGNVRRPKAHLKSSLMIGDVGFFDIRGDFCYCFNIFLPLTDPGQGYHVPPDFEHLSPPLQSSEVVTKPNHFPPGTTLVSPGVDVSCASAEPLDITVTFKAREGGVLILPDGASRKDLVSTARIRDYVLEHMCNWYIHLNPEARHQIACANGSLCVVTGHDKATSWLAAQAGPYNRSGKVRTIRYSRDWWAETIDVLGQSSTVIAQYDIDHCAVFVRTMRFALSKENWIQNVLEYRTAEVPAFHYVPIVPVFGLRASVQTILERVFHMQSQPTSGHCSEHTFHPLVVILQYLIVESPLSNAAIIEDSVWNVVASESDGSLSSTTRALIKLLESHQIVEQNGCATLAPTLASSPSSDAKPALTLSTRKFPFPVSDILKTDFRSWRQRRNIASKLSKVFPGPKIPPSFRRLHR